MRAQGRMCTIMKKQGPSLAYLEQVRQHMSRLPAIEPTTRTLLVCGYPNVGKSSFMNSALPCPALHTLAVPGWLRGVAPLSLTGTAGHARSFVSCGPHSLASRSRRLVPLGLPVLHFYFNGLPGGRIRVCTLTNHCARDALRVRVRRGDARGRGRAAVRVHDQVAVRGAHGLPLPALAGHRHARHPGPPA